MSINVKVARYQGKSMTTLTVSKKNNPGIINGYIEINVPASLPKADEDSRLFQKVSETLQREDIEFTVKDFTEKDFRSMTTKALKDKYDKMGDMAPGAKELMEAVLRERKALPTKEQPKEGKAKRSKAKKAEGQEEGKPRDLKKMLSYEGVNQQLEEARAKKGWMVKFFCQKTQREETGIIKTARLDKRSNFIQFRIEVTEGEIKGQVYGKGTDSEDLTFIGEPKKAEEPKAQEGGNNE